MSEPTPPATPSAPPPENDFAKQAAQPQVGLVREFYEFLIYNASWWITPIVIVLLGFGLLLWVTGTSAAPFIYTIF